MSHGEKQEAAEQTEGSEGATPGVISSGKNNMEYER